MVELPGSHESEVIEAAHFLADAVEFFGVAVADSAGVEVVLRN